MTYEELAREYGEACKRNLEKDAEIAKMRTAIQSEATIHAQHRHAGDTCTCRICRIARGTR